MDRPVSALLRTLATAGDAPAVAVDGTAAVTRAELLATVHRYVDLLDGAGPGDIVTVTDFTTWHWVPAMLATWSRGAAYQPGVGRVAGAPRPRVIIDALGDRPHVERTPPGEATIVSDDVAYIFPTSGSTARPKWVQGRMRGLDHFVAWELRELGVRADDVFSQLTPPTFDPVLRDVLVPLCAGATLAVPDDREQLVLDPAATVAWLKRSGVSVVHAIPTLARLWCAIPDDGTSFASLRALLLAGEPLFARDVDVWRARFGGRTELYNLYGPSETTLAKCVHRVGDGPADAAGRVPVGRPIEGAGVAVLDDGKPCGPYAVGEVVIRTPYASAGYWPTDHPDQVRFSANPLVADDPVPLFRTGDLGHLLPDGRLVIEGRVDDEYKFRGVRVDLRVIEDAIRAVPGVREAALKVAEHGRGPALLAAYVTGDRPATEVARVAMLPPGPRPTAWVDVTGDLPRTHSGKVDRGALPDPPEQAPLENDGSLMAEVLQVWGTVMPFAPQPGRDSSFVLAGGQSIEAVQIVRELEARVGVRLDIRDLYELDTPARLVARLEFDGAFRRPPSGPDWADDTSGASAPLTGAQERFWSWIETDTEPSRFQFLWAAELDGPVDGARLRDVVAQTITDADAQWVTFEDVRGTVHQSALRGEADVRLVDLARHPHPWGEARRDAAALAAAPFRWGTEPLMRARVYRISDQRHVVVMVNHVLASDGWTKERFLHRVSDAYAGIERPPAAPFLAYARHQAGERANWDATLVYWHDQLATVTPPALPYDRPAAPIRTHVASTVAFRIVDEQLDELRAACRRSRVTVPVALLTALVRTLQDWTCSPDGHVLLSNASRNDVRLGDVLGCFTDSLVMTYDALPDDAGEAMLSVMSALTDMLAHGTAGFLWLMQRERGDLNPHDPLTFPVIFAPQPAFAAQLRIPDVRVTGLPWAEPRWIWPVEVYPVIEPEAVHVAVNYSTELFDDDTFQAFIDRLRRAIDELVSESLVKVGRSA